MSDLMKIKSNIWLEIDGQVVLSAWRIKLLLAVQETGSISRGAAKMDIPYRRAWEKIHRAEEKLGFKLIETQVGGAGGGGATLTPDCLVLIDKYTALSQGIQPLLQERFVNIFSNDT